MALTGFLLILAVTVLWVLLFGRVASKIAIWAASIKGVALELDPLCLLKAQGFRINLEKGPISKISFHEFRLFREEDWRKTLQIWWNDGLFPIRLQGAEISVRLFEQHSSHKSNKEEKKETSKGGAHKERGMLVWVWRLIFWILPKTPLTINDTKIRFEELGVVLVVPRLVLLSKNDRGQFHAGLKARPIQLILEAPTDAEETEDEVAFELSEFSARAALSASRGPFPKIRCVDICLGEASLSASKTLLNLAVLIATLKQKQKSHQSDQEGKKMSSKQGVTKDVAETLLQLFPGEASFQMPKIKVATQDLSEQATVYSCLEINTIDIRVNKRDSRRVIQLEGGMGLISLFAGSCKEASAVALQLPSTTIEGNLKWFSSLDSGLATSLSTELHGFNVTLNDDMLWEFIKSALQFGVAWANRFPKRQEALPIEESKDTVETGGEGGEEGKGGSCEEAAPETGGEVELEQKRPSLIASDSMMASADALLAAFEPKPSLRIPNEDTVHEEVSTEDLPTDGEAVNETNQSGQEPEEGPEVNTIGEKELAREVSLSPHSGAQLPEIEEVADVVETPEAFIAIQWAVKLELSDSVVVQLVARDTGQLLCLGLDSVLLRAEDCSEEGNSVVNVDVGFKVLALKTGSGGNDGSKGVLSLASVSMSSTLHCLSDPKSGSQEVNMDGEVGISGLDVLLDVGIIRSVVGVADHVLDQALLVKETVSALQLDSKDTNEGGRSRKKSSKAKVVLGEWTAKAENISVRYGTELCKIEQHIKQDVPSKIPTSVVVGVGSVTAEPKAHWGGAHIDAASIYVDVHMDSDPEGDKIPLLGVSSVKTKLEKRGGMMGLQLIVDGGKVSAEIDAALFAFQVGVDAGGFKHEFIALTEKGKALKPPKPPRTTTSSGAPSPSPSPTTETSPWSSPGSGTDSTGGPSKKQSVLVDICVNDFRADVAVGELDKVSVVVLEAYTDTRHQNPRVHAKSVEVLMNDSRLVQCTGINLRVLPPSTVTDLEKGSFQNRLRRSAKISKDREEVVKNLVLEIDEGAERLAAEPSPLSTKASLTKTSSAQPSPARSASGIDSPVSQFTLQTQNSVASSHLGSQGTFRSIASVETLPDVSVRRSLKHSSSSMSGMRRKTALGKMGLLPWLEGGHPDGYRALEILGIEIDADEVCVMLPHDQDFGRMMMFIELWVEAVKEVVKEYIDRIKTAFKGRSSWLKKRAPTQKILKQDLVEVAIRSRHLSFKIQPHPLEAWLALHGHLLRSFGMQGHSWRSAVEATGVDLSKEDGVNKEDCIKKATEWILGDVFQTYKEKCEAINATSLDALHNQGALMSISAGSVDAVVMVGEKNSPPVIEASVEKIRELDAPTSNNILFSRVQPVYIGATLENIVGHFSGHHAATISEVKFTGVIVRGRQLTHPPKMKTEVFRVGRWHEVAQQLPEKGARPPMKAYTDLDGTLTGMTAHAGIGLEPIWAQMARAFSRLTPPAAVESDGTLLKKPGPTLQPWDKMRYTWRGKMRLRIRQMHAAFAASIAPIVNVQSDRVELNADEMDITVLANNIRILADGLRVALFKAALRAAPEEPLKMMPLAHLPHADIRFKFDWVMPNGRDPLDHYAYPIVTNANPQILLDPVDLTKDFVGEGYTMTISAKLEGDGDSDDKVLEFPQITLGEPQIRFLVEFVRLMEGPPIFIRGAWKRGTYFVRKEKKRTVGPEMPHLLHRLNVSASMPSVEIQHHTLEPDDPSSGVFVCCESVRFAGTWAFLQNIERADKLRAGMNVVEERWAPVDGIWRRIKGDKKAPDMENLEVEAFEIQGFLPDRHATNPLLTRTRPETQHNSFLVHLLQRRTSQSIKIEPDSGSTPSPDGVQGHMLSASCFLLRQLGGGPGQGATQSTRDLQITMPSGEKKRPLSIVISDVKAMMPVEVRNAVLGVYMHMFAAFVGPPKPATAQMTDAARKQELDTDSEVSSTIKSQPQRIDAGYKREDSLLRAILEQNAGGGASISEELRSEASFSVQNVDPPPPGSKLILQLEFLHVQLAVLSDVSEGGVLLTLDSGTLREHLSEEHHIRVMGLNVDHVQCYAMDTSIDPLNPVRWLGVSDGRLEIPPDSTAILTRILKPFRVQMSDTHLLCMAQVLNPDRAAEELKLKAPRIEAVSDSAQFEMLVDVIQSVATPPVPEIKLLRDTILGATGSAVEDTNEDILQAKDMLRSVYLEFNALRQEAFELWCNCGGGYGYTSGALLFDDSVNVEGMRSSELTKVPDAHENLKNFILCMSNPEGRKSPKEAMNLLQTFLDEQIEVALMSCQRAACQLSDIKKEVAEKNKHKRMFKPMSMIFGVDQVSWRLKKDGVEFMQAYIHGIAYSSFQNQDLSGESKVCIHRIELRDNQGGVSSTPGGLEPGIVLSTLNPNALNEEMIRGVAVRGEQTSSHIYYEQIEVWVDPFGLHFTEQVARDLAHFFFPGDDSELEKQQKDWAKSIGNQPALTQSHSSDSETDMTPEPGDDASTLMGGKDVGHRRSSTAETSYSMFTRPDTTGLSTTPLAEIRQESEGGDPLVAPCDMQIVQKKKKKGLAKRRKLYFVRVRFNSVYTRITYEGRPFPFSDLQIKINTAEYKNLEGQFLDIFRRYRNNCIKSIVRSVGTTQGRKYEGMPGGNGEKKKGGKYMRRFWRMGKSVEEGDEGHEQDEGGVEATVLSEENSVEQKGRKMFLGE